VTQLALGQVFIQVLRLSPPVIPPKLYTHSSVIDAV